MLELLLGLCFLQIQCEWGKPIDNIQAQQMVQHALGNCKCILLERAEYKKGNIKAKFTTSICRKIFPHYIISLNWNFLYKGLAFLPSSFVTENKRFQPGKLNPARWDTSVQTRTNKNLPYLHKISCKFHAYITIKHFLICSLWATDTFWLQV